MSHALITDDLPGKRGHIRPRCLVTFLALVCCFSVLLPNGAHGGPYGVETKSTIGVIKAKDIITLDELIRAVASRDENLALAFQCRAIFPPLAPSTELLEYLRKTGKNISEIEKTSAQPTYFVCARNHDSFAYVRANAQITQIGVKWSFPVTVTFLTNDLIFTGMFFDERHSVTVKRFENNPKAFGIPANGGLSVPGVILNLDLANLREHVTYDEKAGKFHVVNSGKEDQEIAVKRDSSGKTVSISTQRDGTEYSLSSSNAGFLYQVGQNGEPTIQLLFENIISVSGPDQILNRLWSALLPSPETLVSFHGDGTNIIFRARGLNPSFIERSIPFGKDVPIKPNGPTKLVKWLLLVISLGGLVVIVALGSKGREKTK